LIWEQPSGDERNIVTTENPHLEKFQSVVDLLLDDSDSVRVGGGRHKPVHEVPGGERLEVSMSSN
jgi:hypothetical protein